MFSQRDPDIPPPEIPGNSAEDGRSGTVAGPRPFPDRWETVTVDFDELMLFPAERAETADESSETLLPDEQGTQLGPALASRAGPDDLTHERTALEDLRAQLRQTEAAIQESRGEAGALKADLDELRALAAELARDYGTIKEASREARDDSETAVAAINEIEQRLGGLTALRQLSTQTADQLAALNALAEDVTHKTRALENEKYLIERTLIEAERLNEMGRARTATLHEGRQEVARTEEMLRRIEQLAAKTTGQLERATKMKDQHGREVARFEQKAQILTESLGKQIEQLVVKKREFEALYRRLGTLPTVVSERAPAVESVPRPIEHSLGDHEEGATTPSSGWEARWVSQRRRLSHTLTILVTQPVSWAFRHRAHVLGGLGVVTLVSFILMRSMGEVDRIGAYEIVPLAQPAPNALFPETPDTMKGSVATSTQTAVTALEQPPGEATLEKPSVRAREFIGTLAVQSDPAGATVFINGRAVGTTPLQVPRLSAGSHAVWVDREGYERWTAGVLVPADRLTRVDVKLQPEAVSAEVHPP